MTAAGVQGGTRVLGKRARKAILAALLAGIVGMATWTAGIHLLLAPVHAEVWLTDARSSSVRLQRQENLTLVPQAFARPDQLLVDASRQYQQVRGFGAALTDSAAWLIHEVLNASARRELMTHLFDPERGIGLNYLRVPVGASDCARTFYTHDDTPPDLADFAITRDEAYTIPVLKDARALNPDLRLIASPWSAPGWMKVGTNTSDPATKGLIGGTLNASHYTTYAAYLREFLAGYARHGLDFEALTLQNEQFYVPATYPGMRLNVSQTRAFVPVLADALATLARPPKILVLDHNWVYADRVLEMLADPVTKALVNGVAWHGYEDPVSERQETVHAAHPRLLQYFTEISGLQAHPSFPDNLAWTFHHVLAGSLQHWASAVLFWNVALDQNGGPTLAEPDVLRGVVTVPWACNETGNHSTGAPVLEGEFYMLGHFSKFLQPGARRVHVRTPTGALETLAFRNPDGSTIVVTCNPGAESRSCRFRAGFRAGSLRLPPGSIATVTW